MSVELYSEDIVVVALAEKPSPFKIWLRAEASGGFVSDLRWLCDESPDYHVIVDLAHVENFGAESCRALADLRALTEEDGYRFVLCGLSSHLKGLFNRMDADRRFDVLDTREAAIAELSPEREALFEGMLSDQAGGMAPRV